MSSSQNQLSVAALIQALECELGRQIKTDPSEIYDVYTANRKKALRGIVGKLRQVPRCDDSVIFWMNFSSALITRIEKRVAYSLQPLTDVERASVFGELSGLRTALRALRWL